MSSRHPRASLPVHGVLDYTSPVIRICGLVTEPLTVSTADLEHLPLETIMDDFICLEGWSVPALEWRGPLLSEVIRLAQPRAETAHVTIAAAHFATSLPVADVLNGTGLLALYLDGQPIPKEHGGPFRLIVPGGECFTSIKWVDRIELTVASVRTSEEIARGRLDTSGPQLP